MGKGGSSGSSTTTNNVPPEMAHLTTVSADKIEGLQNQNPLSDFTAPNPTAIAPLNYTQQQATGLMQNNLSDATRPLEESNIVQAGNRYFDNSIAPGIQNSATLSGLGRSTAAEAARAAAESSTMLPLLQGEQSRRDAMIKQGMDVGDVERSITQAENNAQQADAIRRQALAEQALFAAFPTLPSTLGQSTLSKTSGGGGGMFK